MNIFHYFCQRFWKMLLFYDQVLMPISWWRDKSKIYDSILSNVAICLEVCARLWLVFFQRFSVESRMELNEDTVEIIKATAPVLKEHGLAITIRFYENLFKNHPYVNQFFNKNHIFPKNGEVSQQVKIKFFFKSKSHLKVI